MADLKTPKGNSEINWFISQFLGTIFLKNYLYYWKIAFQYIKKEHKRPYITYFTLEVKKMCFVGQLHLWYWNFLSVLFLVTTIAATWNYDLFLDSKNDDQSKKILEQLETIDDDCDRHGIILVKLDNAEEAAQYG